MVLNLAVIGKAVKAVSVEVRVRHPQVSWRRIGALRDILIHHYFEIDLDIVWDVVCVKLPELKQQIDVILRDPQQEPKEP